MARGLRLRSVAGWAGLAAALAAASLFSANPFFTAAAFAVLTCLILFTWRAGEPPVLLFAVTYQWLQVSMKILHADVAGQSVASVFPHPAGAEALRLSLLGLLVLGAGMALGLFRLKKTPLQSLQRGVRSLSVNRVFALYVAAFAVKTLSRGFARGTGGFAQILLAIFNLKWLFFFLLAYLVLARRRGHYLLVCAIAFEVVIGFTGFFASFKEVFFVLLVAYLCVKPQFNLRNASRVAGVTLAVFLLGAVWMSVRTEYRQYVSGGQRAQVVEVEFFERSKAMAEMILTLDTRQLAVGVEKLAMRVAYVDFFSHVLFTVPRLLPHEHGVLWRDAVLHVLKPRLFFPNKPILPSDSELTMRYSGMWLASGSEGTSISMGYFAESYIDFGKNWMMVPILLVGVAWGLIYRYFMTRRVPRIYAFAAAVTVLINANQFEMHNLKLVGSVLMGFIVTAMFVRWGLPLVHRYLARRPVRPAAIPARLHGAPSERA